MRRLRLSITPELLAECGKAVALTFFMTIPMFLIGRQTLGESVIALLYLAAVGWSAGQWGRLPGMCAAITATLTFNFLFIPPFFTFAVGQLEGWLVLTIFLGVSILVVGRFREPLAQARISQRDAQLMYEMSIALSGQRTRKAVLHALARNLLQTFYASAVQVTLETETGPISAAVKVPADGHISKPPDRVIPVQAAPGLIGEIHIWRGNGWLPPEESRLLLNLAALAATAIERARTTEMESVANHPAAAGDR
jgi:two-component system sensor histidine kinase KdpD